MSQTATGPLAGLRVIDLGGIGPGPFCTMLLADLGAEVIRIHRPDEAGNQPNPVLDRGQRSVAIDLKDPAGVEIVWSLIDDADAVIEGFRPGVAERLGFDPARLRNSNPRVVFGRMTGFGQDGPLAMHAGHDINYIALSGALGALGPAGRAPTPPLNLIGDFGGGGMLLAFGVVSAILHARETGQGQIVDAAMVEGSGLLMSMMYGRWAQGGWTLDRGRNLLDGGAPFYDVYECADGKYVSVGALEPAFFVNLVEMLGLADTIDPAAQLDRDGWPAMRAAFADAFRAATRDEWAERFTDVDGCVAPVLTMGEVLTHEHNADRESFYADDDGTTHPSPAPRFAATPCAAPAPAPVPGEHTRAVLAELGHTPGEIEAFMADGTVV